MRDTLHWLQVRQRILYRVSTIPWRCSCLSFGAFALSSSCPGRRSLRSTSCGEYLIPHSYTASKQNRAFLAADPTIWNCLPLELRSLPSDLSTSFYSLLKTFLFAHACVGALLSSYFERALYKFHI